MATGEIWNGTAVIPVYNNVPSITNATTPKAISVNLSQVKITWDGKGPPPNVTNSDTLAFTLPSGYTSGFVYKYDLHGHTNPVGSTPQFVTTIKSTLSSETPLTSSIPINWNGTDWWYGNPASTYPLANVGNMANPPSSIDYNYTNINQVTSASWNIHIDVGIASNAGGGGDGSYTWWEIIGIVALVLVIIIIFCYIFASYTNSPVSSSSYNSAQNVT